MTIHTYRRIASLLWGLSLTTVGIVAHGSELDRNVSFHIQAQRLDSALIAVSRQAHVQIVVAAGSPVENLRSPALNATLSVRAALQVILKDTGLKYSETGDTVSIFPMRREPPALQPVVPEPNSVTPQNVAGSGELHQTGEKRGKKAEQISGPGIEEIVVTGSHIHGAQDLSSPLTTVTREDIEHTGLTSTADLMRTLPQNFGGGATDLTNGEFAAGDGSESNFSQGTGINLRGLGTDATLVLLNGRRLAPSSTGNFVDVSLIPLAAIDRVEVMADGSSAIYGSDAVGGVVNIITRKNYEGAESRVGYGSVTSGDRWEFQAGQVVGHGWGSGSALISYDYLHDSPLRAQDRSFASGLLEPPAGYSAPAVPSADLLPSQTRHSVLASLTQNVSPALDATADGYYARRANQGADATYPTLATSGELAADNVGEQYGGTLGATARLPSDWRADAAATYSRNNTSQLAFFDGSIFGTTFVSHSSALALEASVDGAVAQAPGGAVKLASGVQYRREAYDSSGTRDPVLAALSRTVDAVFAELLVPVIGEANGLPGVQRLDFSAAGRYEHYSDFGSASDPKLGLSWFPVSSLKVRGTWGRSFRAPLLSELDDTQPEIIGLPFPDAGGRTTPGIYVNGGNPQLQPEKATNWTVGMDFAPPAYPGLKAALTYFSVDFRDRVASPIPTTLLGLVLQNEGPYAPFIERNPSPALVAQLFNNPVFHNPFGLTPASIGVVVQDSLTNVSVRNESGLDLSVTDKWETAIGRFDATVAGTYLTKLQDTVLPNTQPVSILNTLFNPIRFKMRNSLGWSWRRVSTTAFLNYSGAYTNNITIPSQPVASWTTIDFNVRYDTGNDAAYAVRNLAVALTVVNALDRNPPFVGATAESVVNFDAANASPLGRFITLQVSKAW